MITSKAAKDLSKNEVILELLKSEGPLSTHQVVERFNSLGLRLSTGQALTRLRVLSRRNPPAVEEVEGERGRLWRVV